METDQPLPVAFWQPVAPAADTAPSNEVDSHTPPVNFDLARQWAPAFRDMGFDIHIVLPKLVGTHSALLNKTLLTIEDVFHHLTMQQNLLQQGELVQTTPEPSAGEKESLRSSRSARAQAIAIASAEWHAACEQRKEAMRGWDDYVKGKKKILQDLKNS